MRKIHEIIGREPPIDNSLDNFENKYGDSEEALRKLIDYYNIKEDC